MVPLSKGPKQDQDQRDKLEIPDSGCFRFQALVRGYRMDGYIRASGFVLYPYVFVAGATKHDCSRRTQLREKF